MATIEELHRLNAEAERIQRIVALRLCRLMDDEWRLGRDLYMDTAKEILTYIALPELLAKAEAHDALVAALKWYEVQTRQCRLIHSEGDAGRALLSADGGAVARAALAKLGGRDE